MKKTVLLALMVASVALHAELSISSISYQEINKASSTGEKTKAWVKTHKVIPGTIIRYVNSLNNSGIQMAKHLVVSNPIPNNMEYIAGSASCVSECIIKYSVDGGQIFDVTSELFLGMGEERHLAQAKEYTHIQWVLNTLDGQSNSNVEYQARLK